MYNSAGSRRRNVTYILVYCRSAVKNKQFIFAGSFAAVSIERTFSPVSMLSA